MTFEKFKESEKKVSDLDLSKLDVKELTKNLKANIDLLYSDEEYNKIKNDIISYMKNSFGQNRDKRMSEISEESFDKLSPVFARGMVLSFWTSKKGDIDLDKFMNTFNIKHNIVRETQMKTTYTEDVPNDKFQSSYGVGVLRGKSPEEMEIFMESFDDLNLKLFVEASADGTPVKDDGITQVLKGKEKDNIKGYYDLRTYLLSGFEPSDPIYQNLDKLFPNYNEKDIRDRAISPNRIRALRRAMNEVSFLPLDVKKRVFTGSYDIIGNQIKNVSPVESEEVVKIGNTIFKITTFDKDHTGDDFTIARTEIAPTASYQEIYAKYFDFIDNSKIIFHVDGGNSQGYVGYDLKGGIMTKESTVVGGGKIKGGYNWNPDQNIHVVNSGTTSKNINVKVPAKLEGENLTKYGEYFNYPITSMGFKKSPTFEVALQMAKDFSDGSENDYLDKQNIAWKNYVYLNKEILENPVFRNGFLNFLANRKPNLTPDQIAEEMAKIEKTIKEETVIGQ